MRILHVIHGVRVVLALNGLDVEIDHLVIGLCHERVTRSVGTDLLKQLIEGDHSALALAHAHRCAVAQEVDELAEHDLELIGVTKGLADGLDALDVAVVIGTPQVDDMIHTLELVPVIGNVGGKVGVLAVRLDKNAVLVVAELGGAEPQRAGLVAEQIAELVELGEGAVYRRGPLGALLIKAALREPHIEVAASLMTGLADGLKHHLVAALAERGAALVLVDAGEQIAVGSHETSRKVNDVVAGIRVSAESLVERIGEGMSLGGLVRLVGDVGLSVGKKDRHGLIAGLALTHELKQLQITLGDRVAEDVHLGSVVVDVVLALHVVAGPLEHVAQRVAEGGPTAMADVQRTHGVCGYELDLDLLSRAHSRTGEVVAGLADNAEDVVRGGGVQVEVNEAGAGDLDLCDGRVLGEVSHDSRGDLCGGAVGQTRGAHGDGRGPVAVR